jgi:hypothetical protein
MKKIVIRFLSLIIGFIIIAGILIGLWYLITNFWRLLMSLQKEVSVAIIAAVSTVFVSVFSVTVVKYYEHKRMIDQELRQKNIPIYEGFIEFLFKIWHQQHGKELSDKEMQKFVTEFNQKLIIWGSDDLIKQWSNYRKRCINVEEGSKNFEIMFDLEKLFLTIRKEIGHKNKDIEKGTILSMFINDIDKYM